MLVKGLVFTALVASAPIALVATQDPRPGTTGTTAASESSAAADLRRLETQNKQAAVDLAAARRELAAARRDLQKLGEQLECALDALDSTVEPQRERNCSPSRSRALMSHYQWLRSNGHEQRASAAVAKVVDQLGDNPQRLNSAARELMTDKETAGQFDEVALAISERMQKTEEPLGHNQLDTVAFAHFLNGKFESAIALQQQAIERGGNSDDYRRRLRTYQSAQAALVKAAADASLPVGTMVASGND
ncbi:MAG: hypothetical protein ABIP94_14015 [Planctomycetota bacterium]